jgi:redox-sensitive bicupin YhaK (pirin superfamily)
MRAGSGIRHRQMNPSADAVDHHLQIWIEPRTPGLAPAVAQRQLRVGETSAWTCVASPDGRRDSFAVDADVVVEQATLIADARLDRPPSAGRWHYLHVVGGEVLARTEAGFEALLLSGDALLVLSDDEAVRLHGRAAATRLLAFDVAREDVERAR